MRLLLVSHAAGPYGAERVLLGLAGGLARRGHDVVVEMPQSGPALDEARQLAGVECRLARRHRLPRNARETIGYLAAAGSAIRSARRTIDDVEPDVVWVNSLYNPWAGIAAGSTGRPVVWHLHEYRLPEPLGTTVGGLIAASATRVAVVSEFVADGWSRYPWLRRRISVVPNPLLDEPGRAAEPTGSFTVGYVGQLEPRKRVIDLVRAVSGIPDARAVIVGDGKATAAVKSAIREAGVGQRVELTGFQSDVASQMNRFHCMAIPSVREPFGLVALEAMAAGVPVVAARSGALPEVLGAAALYHRPRDPSSLADQIRKIKADRTLRGEMVEAGLRRVEEFREEHWLDRVEEIARSAIRQSRNTA